MVQLTSTEPVWLRSIRHQMLEPCNGLHAVSSVMMSTLAFLLICLPARSEEQALKNTPLAAFSRSLTRPPAPSTLTNRGAVYVPTYSSIRAGTGRGQLDFAVTLSIHNTSELKPLIVEQIDYFDTAGELVERYLKDPVAIRPLGTIEIFIPAGDTRGGTGANFVVKWAGTGPIAEPAIEAVMVSTAGTNSYSLISPGRPIKSIGHE